MTDVPAHHVRAAAHVVREEIVRRQRFGIPIPNGLRDLDAALFFALLSEAGQQTCQTPSDTEQSWETATQRAQRLGVHPRTIRRHAHRHGGRKIGQQWTFPTQQTT
ncbi:helix-turn-helix domain-containing protein [Mycolicibacterium novocastrense]|nr:helix-turn-helix domain-containing protein [Mycolicibacterium novocastrense]